MSICDEMIARSSYFTSTWNIQGCIQSILPSRRTFELVTRVIDSEMRPCSRIERVKFYAMCSKNLIEEDQTMIQKGPGRDVSWAYPYFHSCPTHSCPPLR